MHRRQENFPAMRPGRRDAASDFPLDSLGPTRWSGVPDPRRISVLRSALAHLGVSVRGRGENHFLALERASLTGPGAVKIRG